METRDLQFIFAILGREGAGRGETLVTLNNETPVLSRVISVVVHSLRHK